ncbi:hypothetical protein [Alkalibacter saccharofermentans]|jgi:hypothetical protein|uniref:Uncharacterized protein n=1 Tax=Alkalibacter saccharofermentans DSM 14828 TaxID=1120975 RepID=A0A1M4S6W2_9FIRM|nr:hypothetical protein [Alkalibacter saccharofermentans]SHE27915.1 hypothetical protein SAMN02746064_00118 [Alkalibacter saccharofermentans DSM 14828]
MDGFITSLSGITTLLNPVMTFIMLMSVVFFLLFLREKVEKTEAYIRSIAISLQQIAQQLSKKE